MDHRTESLPAQTLPPGVGPTVAYDADTKTARVTGCTDVLDETKTYLIDVVYNEQFYKVSFGDDIRENLTWNDIVTIPAVPASGDGIRDDVWRFAETGGDG